MKQFFAFSILLGVLGLAGCNQVKTAQKTGTEFNFADGSRPPTQTYVTAEEYERMTPQERERVHAAMGADASLQLWGKDKTNSGPLNSDDLDKAAAERKAEPSRRE